MEDARRPTESPIRGANIALATILRHFLLVGNRRTFGLHSCLGVVTEVDDSGANAGEGSAAVTVSAERPAIDALTSHCLRSDRGRSPGDLL